MYGLRHFSWQNASLCTVFFMWYLFLFTFPSQAQSGVQTAAPKDRRFSHKRHAITVRVSCDRCHKATREGSWALQGKQEHARCFSCHKYSASCSTLAKRDGMVCLSCHTTFKKRCTPAQYTPPPPYLHEFSSRYSHRKHMRSSEKTGQACEQCHGAFGQRASQQGKLLGHSLCSACHARGVLPHIQNGCATCHVEGPTRALVVKQRTAYSVAATFNHKRHAQNARVGTQGATCLTCHGNIKEAKADTLVPMPTMAGCLSCHNGKQAFNALGTTCTQCHRKGGI